MAKLIINIFVAFPSGISRKNVSKTITLPTEKKTVKKCYLKNTLFLNQRLLLMID